MENGKEVLRVENLHVFIDEDVILEDINFVVHEGDFVAILGPNGAGKSVLLRAILGLLPYKGKVILSPETVIGYVPQRFAPEHDLPLSAEEWLKLSGVNQSIIEETLNKVGFPLTSLYQPIGILSQGQLQRLMLAFALLRKPTLLFVDEPLAAVDAIGSEAISQLLSRLSKEEGIAVIFVSHDLILVNRAASHVVCLNRVQVCFGNTREALNEKTLKELFGPEQTIHQHIH
ncbi:MAG: hypothetical protein UU22_C0026G0004 [Parcubacteria group bacterium GW2011_GWA2_40_8]|nr:MAG: hypothetical protein UT82_C0036G0003 [Parcubacteria group bacterium GW2011_GWB1_40_14]KKR78402.1 MAG: hypothetical protein UU22_C0026G0004 [Parcubacteria group bacterium GW2011_GWA2_40_8]